MPIPPSYTIPESQTTTPESHHYAQNHRDIMEKRINVSYPDKVHPETLEEYKEQVLEKYRKQGYANLWDIDKACVLHHYVSQNFTYVDGWNPPRDFYSLPYIAENLQGNCEEASVLLASLLLTIPELDVKLTVVKSSNEGGHLSLGVCFHTKYANRRIREWYSYHFDWDFNSHDLDFCQTREEEYHIIDPLMSRYIGDSQTLNQEGYYNPEKGLKEDESWTVTA